MAGKKQVFFIAQIEIMIFEMIFFSFNLLDSVNSKLLKSSEAFRSI